MVYRSKFGGGRKQLIARAVGVKGKNLPTVLDATAGFGVDAFVLASLGCDVTMVERSPIIGELLADGLRRAQPKLNAKNIKLKLVISQAIDYINNFLCMDLERPDVIYIDPMYPERTKSALGKKEMRVLREIVGDDEDIAEVFAVALKVAKKRVVVKRPRHAPLISSQKPSLSISSGKSSRYDVYLTQNKT